ncbi:MAG: zinc-binding dehydrogenase [Acidimicrobiia bacterium]|nr:zinc-binding dehydrogenase [Acidimicrobiia bacterium]
MKASVVTNRGGGFSVGEVQLAEPIGREVVVDVKASGLCHTDLTLANADLGYPVPAVFGHEAAGVVVAVGPDVTQVEQGDHVVGCLIQFCGQCVKCLSGRTFECLQPGFTLRGADDEPRLVHEGKPISQAFGLGGFAERALVHENQLAVVPDELPFPQAALLGCGVVTGAGAVLNTAKVQRGETVVVMGAGGVGLNAVSGAVLAGASRIVVTDITDGKLERARAFGATDVINSSEHDPVEAVRALLPNGADHVFDFVGARPVTAQGLQMLGVGGGLYLIGIMGNNPGVDLDALALLNDKLRVEGVYMGSSNLKRDIPFYAQMSLKGRFNLEDLVSKEISLSQIDEGYDALKDGSIARVVITDFAT